MSRKSAKNSNDVWANRTEVTAGQPPQAASASPSGDNAPDPGTIAAESVRIEEDRREPRRRGVMGHAAVVSGATLLSRLSGVVRDVMLAGLFGFSREMDAFFLAFTVPNLFRKLFGEGALASAAIPVLTRYRAGADMEATRRYLGTLLTLLALVLSGLVAVILAVVYLLPLAWFNDPEKFLLFRGYLTVLLPYVVFICIAALQAGALNTWERFGVPAGVPALANVGWIAVIAVIWLTPARHNTEQAVMWMAIGVLLTGVLQWVAMLPSLRATGLLARPRLTLKEPGIRSTILAMLPMLLALAVFQINTFLDQVLAELLVAGNGAVSSYSFASRLFQFPLGLVAVAVATAMFPLMSRFAQNKEFPQLTASLLNSARLLMFIALPAAAGLAVLAYPVTELLFGGSRSEPEMLVRSSRVLALLCLSLPLVSVIGLLNRAFYSLRDYRTPTYIAIVAVIVNVIANVILLQTPLLEAGLALGTAISGALNLGLQVLGLRKHLRGTVLDSVRAAAVPPPSERLARPFTPSMMHRVPLSILRSLAVALVMAAGAWAMQGLLFEAFGLTGRASRAVSVSGAVLAGVVIYAGLSVLMKAPEIGQILTLRKRR
jgi:putative peptidoglycan lipid II flippase